MAINMECNRIEVNKHCVKDFIYVSSIGNSGVYEGCNGITHTRNFFFGGVCKWNSVGVHYFQTSSQELTSPNMKDREFHHKNAGRILPWDSVFKPCNFQRQFEDLSLLLVVISPFISLYLGDLNQYLGNFINWVSTTKWIDLAFQKFTIYLECTFQQLEYVKLGMTWLKISNKYIYV